MTANIKGDLRARLYGRCVRDEQTGCLIWTGAQNGHGYGRMGAGKGVCSTHRVAWELHNGPLEPDQWLLHSCDVRRCCEITHLRIGTPAENTWDAIERGRFINPPLLQGSNNKASKLTEKDVNEIRLLLAQGMTHRQIGLLYGVSKYPIWRIANGKGWGHVC